VSGQNWVSLLNPNAYASGAGAAATLAASGTFVLSPQSGVTNQDVAVVQQAGAYQGWDDGLLIAITARGYYTSTTTTGTLTFQIRYNKGNSTAAASQTVLLATNGITTPTSVVTGMQWTLRALLRCTEIAVSGTNTVSAQGELNFHVIAGSPPALPASPVLMSTAPGISIPMPNASGETATQVDTTQMAGINLGCTSTAAQGTVQLTQWLVEALD
jgi:hypothetical protein